MTFNPLGLQVNIISDKSNSRSSGISSEASENIDNYIEDIVDRKMRINAKPKVKRNMINAMKTIFNTLIKFCRYIFYLKYKTYRQIICIQEFIRYHFSKFLIKCHFFHEPGKKPKLF